MKLFPLWMLSALLLASLSITACDANKGPAEKAGEKVDQAVDDAGEAMEDAGEAMEDAAN